ncbi:TPA: hypothetical protein NM844_002069 [Salmonella enterica]|nr:hypothetical protein [Salmonella enterica]
MVELSGYVPWTLSLSLYCGQRKARSSLPHQFPVLKIKTVQARAEKIFYFTHQIWQRSSAAMNSPDIHFNLMDKCSSIPRQMLCFAKMLIFRA